MLKKALALQKLGKRKRDDADQHRSRRSPSSTPSQSSGSHLSGYLTDGAGSEINSPQASVSGRLEELELHGKHSTVHVFQGPASNQGVSDQAERATTPHNTSDITPTHISDAKEPEKLSQSGSPPRKRKQSSSPSGKKHTRSPRAKSKTNSPDKPKRKGSPPLETDPSENPLTWHESELTVYDPDDPDDDGYGVNGVGFKATPAIAWDQAQRRKKQIAEYKHREDTEARERRRSRRSGIFVDDSPPSSKSHKKVKFVT